METSELEDMREWKKFEREQRRGKIAGAMLIIGIGAIFLMRELGMVIPTWVITWKMLLIGIGLVAFVKNGFRRMFWVVPIAVGAGFLLADQYPEMHLKAFLLPVLLILIGLIILFKPRGNKRHMMLRHRMNQRRMQYWKHWHEHGHQNWKKNDCGEQSTMDDHIESMTIFAGIKKNILTKNFKGGEVSNFLGGTEINLSQADFTGTVRLELTQVLGGTKLIVPSNWEIKSDLLAIFGSIEDKRLIKTPVGDQSEKVLLLEGFSLLGGVEIHSYS